MTKKELTTELRDGTKEIGFRKGARVMVNGRIGTVNTKIVRGPDKPILQSVKFDEADENGKLFGSFPHTELTLAAPVEHANECELLGNRIRMGDKLVRRT